MEDILWEANELPDGAYVRKLSSFMGSSYLRDCGALPVAARRDDIMRAIVGNGIVAIKAATGSGKTMIVPQVLQERCPKYAVAIVLPSNFAVVKLQEAFERHDVFSDCVHVRTGENDEDRFDSRRHQVSIITYGILWKWISTYEEKGWSPVHRYGGFFLDEFADLQPTEEMAARILGSLLRR
eukprot:5194808-Pyramimonas_sp.AAC.1